MGELVTGFGGKVNGELIKASDWNGMLAKVEELLGNLATELGSEIDGLKDRADELENRASAAESRLDAAEQTLEQVQSRFRRLTLRASSTTYTIGQRGEITAQVTALDGSPLDLSNAATRPWVDFVTVWGTLKAASGFTSRGGAGDQTLSVQVNAEGIARVLIRSAHAEAFAEEEELEIESFLQTRPLANNTHTMAEIMLTSNNPRDTTMIAAYQAITREYDRTGSGTPMVQRYIDTYYVTQPSRAVGSYTSVYSQRWRDYRATLMAFLKPDSNPTTADGALASASIQVSFRDWIAPWIVVDYLPGVVTMQAEYADRFRNLIGPDLGGSIDHIVGEVNEIIRGRGLIGRQRDFLAIEEAVAGMRFDTDPPPFMADLVQSVRFGTQVQHAMFYGQAITPGGDTAARSFEAVAGSAGRASSEAGRIGEQLTRDIDDKLTEATDTLLGKVNAAQAEFQNDLLREDGPIMSLQRDVRAFSGTVQGFERALGGKADVNLIENIVGTLPR